MPEPGTDPVEWVRERWVEQELPEADRFAALASMLRAHQALTTDLDRRLRPFGLTDEIAFVAGGGAPIPRLAAHAAALADYRRHPASSFRDPETGAQEPIYSVHYNRHAARAMGVAYQYDVGFQRQSWQVHHLTHWCSDFGWVKEVEAEYRRFVYLSDVIEHSGTVTGVRTDADGEHVVDIETRAINQRGENVMPGRAVVALPARGEADSPAQRRARSG